MNYIAKKLMIALTCFMFLVSGVGEINTRGLTGVSVASAQETKKKRRSLFSILFGKRKAKKKSVRKKKRSKKVRRGKKKSGKRNRKTRSASKRKTRKLRKKNRKRIAAVPIVKKSEDARTVLVIGDFLGGGLADGLKIALSANAAVKVVDRTKGSSGFVRSDIVDWPARLPKLVEELKPAYVIAMLGTNDRQTLRTGGGKLKKGTESWNVEYKKRISTLGTALKQSNVPFTWVGLPPVRFTSMSADFLKFNEWYRAAALLSRGAFVDVWDGFSNATGAYTRSGPDVNGQIVLLRGKDGINLTKAGRRRLAFYVEGEIVKRFGGALSVSSQDDLSGVDVSVSNRSNYNPAVSGTTIVIKLNDPSSDGGGKLAGENVELDSGLGDVTRGLLEHAAPAKARDGRVDNFAWPPVSALPQSNGTATN